MGGIWGLAAAISLENIPTEARGVFSGLLQQGYSLGYLIAAGINLRAGTNTTLGYRLIFIVGAGLTGVVALVTMFVPESKQYRGQAPSTRAFVADLKLAARQYWRTFLYCILLSMSFNWMSHGSQDVYPNFLKIQKGLGNYNASVATMIGQTGAVVGGFVTGYYSQFFGRRLTIVTACCFGLAMIPLWTLPNTFAPLAVGEFFLQAAQNGAWGMSDARNIPIGRMLTLRRMHASSAQRICATAVSRSVSRHNLPARQHAECSSGGDSDRISE